MVAPDHVDGHAGGDGLGERGLDFGVRRAVIVVAQPQVEHVTEEVETIRPPRRSGEELEEGGDRVGPMLGEMDVAGEQEHYGDVG